MGSILVPSISRGSGERRVVMPGLDASGKTTILYQLRLGEVVSTIPTIGFNVETIHYKNIRLTVWDVGGQDKIRPLWAHYFQYSQAVIFVIDSADLERLDIAITELNKIIANETLERDCRFLIFANKQDLPTALPPEKIKEKLDLSKLPINRWHIQGCSAANGEGLYEGLDWLATQLNPRNSSTSTSSCSIS